MNGQPARPAPIPLTIVAGFPGAGKTRLIRQWLAARPEGTTRALLSGNGAAAFAADALGPAATAGCLCCTGSTATLAALEDLLRQRDNHRIAPFDWVLIELDGLADPIPALAAITRHPYLALRYAPTGMVTLIDPHHADAALARHAPARRQIALAHRLIASRSDVALSAAVRAELAGLNPVAAVRIGTPSDDTATTRTVPLSTAHWPEEDRRAYHSLGLSGTARPHRGVARTEQHSSATEEWVFEHAQALSEAELGPFLDQFARQFGPQLIRLSGRVSMAGAAAAWIEMTMGRAEPPMPMPTAATGTRLVVLAEAGVKPAISKALAQVFTAKTGSGTALDP